MSEVDRPDLNEIRVPFRDVDMNGRMFLAAYISQAETALSNFWRTHPEIENEPSYTAAKVSCVIHRDLRYDERATFHVSVDKIGVKTVGFIVAIEADGEVAAEVEILWQARSEESGEPVALPEDTRDWLFQFLE
jgi:acyl-CoA thioester hydrolase